MSTVTQKAPKVVKNCPRCGLEGYGQYPKTFHGKKYWYFCHKKVVTELAANGKPKRSLKWCYVGKVVEQEVVKQPEPVQVNAEAAV